MEYETFIARACTLRQRVQQLYRVAAPASQAQPLLQKALDELETAVELIDLADAELRQMQSEMHGLHQATQLDLQLYQELFTCAPAPYVVTSLSGTIRKANRAAAQIFGVPEAHMVGRALALFIPEGQRRAFRDELARRCQTEDGRPWLLHMQWPDRGVFEATTTLGVVRNRYGEPQSLRWLFNAASVRQ